MRITTTDRIGHKITSRTVTDEGFLSVPAYVARTGVQNYLARELGLEGDPNRIVRVMRSEDEVFNSASLATYANKDVTFNHPASGFVNSTNYSALSKGTVVGVGVQDGDFVKCDLIVKDQATIDAINNGKCELSAGYTAYYDAVDHPDYEYMQREIVINHVAVVDNARAGGQARIFDSQHNEGNMKKITIDSQEVEVPQVVVDHIAKITADNKNQKEEIERLKEERKEDDYDVEELRKEKREAEDALNKLMVEQVTKDAKFLCGDDFATVSNDSSEIMRQALKGRNLDGKSNEYIKGVFDSALEEKRTVDTQHRQFSQDGAQQQKPAYDARAELLARQATAWRTK